MQCVVASPKLWLWPGVVSARFKSGGGSGFRSGPRRLKDGSISSGLGFSGSGVLGGAAEIGELKIWKQESVVGSCKRATVHASLMVDPAVSLVRVLVFYVLLQTGIAGRGRASNQSSADDSFVEEHTAEDNGPFAWVRNLFSNDTEEKKNKELAKVRAKWHASTKGTLVRRYRVPTKAGGRKLLTAIMQLLSDDDTFRDVATHKGCQIRRENAHAESVCCHNVRALFDELPTPHLVVEITVFPAGPITAAHYEKADKIEKVLKTGVSI
ncbi:hypothetical protein Mapa_010595 [Marchantia paleacea]|nr:hypothetical protein Mapa_010595 [Marchantia paleacea]